METLKFKFINEYSKKFERGNIAKKDNFPIEAHISKQASSEVQISAESDVLNQIGLSNQKSVNTRAMIHIGFC